MKGEPIPLYNHGNMKRDFTYIDDIVGGMIQVIDTLYGDPANKILRHESDAVPHQIYNLGHGARVQLMDFIAVLEKCLGRKAKLDFLPIQK